MIKGSDTIYPRHLWTTNHTYGDIGPKFNPEAKIEPRMQFSKRRYGKGPSQMEKHIPKRYPKTLTK